MYLKIGVIGGAVARQVDVTINSLEYEEENNAKINLENKELVLKIGAEYNGDIYYINYGNFIVTEFPENDETNGEIKAVALDYMKKFDIPFKDTYDYNGEEITITYPCTLKAYLQHTCNQTGTELGTQTFANEDFIITNNQFEGKTCRKVLQDICKCAFTWARIKQDNKLYLDFEATGEVVETITEEEYYSDSFKKANEYFGTINKVVYMDRDVEGQEVSVVDSADILENGEKELTIYDNYFAYTTAKKQELIQAGTRLFGFRYMPISQLDMKGLVYLDSNDFIKVIAPDETEYLARPFNHTIKYQGFVQDSITIDAETETEQEYENTTSPVYQNAKTEIMVDRANQSIQLLTSRTIIVYDEIEKQGLIETKEAKELATWQVKLIGEKTYESEATVVPVSYTIVVIPERYPYISTENDEVILTEDDEELIYSAHKYTIECDELLRKDAVSDIITIDEDRNIILTKRIGIENGETYILDEEVTTILGTLTVELYEGINYIYLEQDGQLDEETMLYMKYILKNDFTSNYVSSQEIISAINLSPEETKIQSPKISLEGYTTINEGFSVDEEGNMTCNDATINGTIRDDEGNVLVWNDGVYTNMSFVSSCINNGELYGALLSNIGYFSSTSTIYMSYLIIEANIPSNFSVTEAHITVTHQPIEYSGSTSEAGTDVSLDGIVGFAKSIQVFADDSIFGTDMYSLDFGSEVLDDREMIGTDTKALGTNGKTFSKEGTEVIISEDLSKYLQSGQMTVFKIGSLTPASSIDTGTVTNKIKNMYRNTGRAVARLDVYGYLK